MTAIVRLVVSLAAGWVVAGVAVAVFMHYFSPQQMNYVAFVAIGLGLCTAGACWRATRSWRPRRLTPAEMAEGFDVHLGKPFLAFLVVIGIVTFGTFALALWLVTRRWPKRLDPEGMTLRNGRRLAWQDVTEVTTRAKRIVGVPISRSWHLRGGGVKADVVPNSLAEGPSVLEFLQAALGETVLAGSFSGLRGGQGPGNRSRAARAT